MFRLLIRGTKRKHCEEKSSNILFCTFLQLNFKSKISKISKQKSNCKNNFYKIYHFLSSLTTSQNSLPLGMFQFRIKGIDMQKLLKQFRKSSIGIAEDKKTEKKSQFFIFHLCNSNSIKKNGERFSRILKKLNQRISLVSKVLPTQTFADLEILFFCID